MANNINLITMEELNSLDCPTVETQENSWNAIMKLFDNDETRLKLLVESLGYGFVRSKLFKPSKEDKSNYNPIYILTVEDENQSEIKLILKIAEPHPFLERKNVTNEVAVINYLRQHSKIPVPLILSYSNDKQTSLLGCEYILMKKIEGKFLREIFKTPDEMPDDLKIQLLDFYKELKLIKINGEQKIGHFNDKMQITPCYLIDNKVYATNKEHKDYLSHFKTMMEWILKEMNKVEKFLKLAQALHEFTQELTRICENNTHLNNLNLQDEMSIFNSAINGWNILIDEKVNKITAFTDWQYAFYGFDSKELEFLNDIFAGKEKYKLFDEINKKSLDWYHEAKGKNIIKYLEDLLQVSHILIFYFSNWFKIHNCTIHNHMKHWFNELSVNLAFSGLFLDSLREFKIDKDFKYFEITAKELELLENPSFKSQLDEKKKISLTENKIRKLIESIDLKFKSFEIMNHNNGIVNGIYLIKVEENQSEDELILKISDTHPWFTSNKVANEVGVINYLRQHSKIPVPLILSYSNDKQTSLLGCEYILMKKVKGRVLRELIDEKFQNVNQLPEKIIDQMLCLLKELNSIKFKEEKLGNFDLSMNIVSDVWPEVEPCEKFLELINKRIDWSIKEMKKIKIYKELVKKIELFQENLNKIAKENSDLDDFNFNDKMSLVHGDLHAGNIFVDPDTYEITAIIDWEWAHHGFDDMQIQWIATWYHNSDCKQILKDKIESKSSDWFKETKGKKFREFLRKEQEFRETISFLAPVLVNIGMNETNWYKYFFAKSSKTIEKSAEIFESMKAYRK